MNAFQTNLYDNLNKLVATNEAFYRQENWMCGCMYHIFNYRLASWTDFHDNEGALECRGITFRVNQDSAIELVSFPMPKFFNLQEGDNSSLDYSTTEELAIKADGSLISTYMVNDTLMLKSKGSLYSDQAFDAREWLETNIMYSEIVALERLGYTVIMEWCSPKNRIVLGYECGRLIVLGVRNRADGEFVHYSSFDNYTYPNVYRYWTPVEKVEDPASFINSIQDMTEIEGYVVRLESGHRVKVKTLWYVTRHHTKDSITNPRRLFDTILAEAVDDLRMFFVDDSIAMQTIDKMEEFVDHQYNHLVDTVEKFYDNNQHLSRKDYAVKGQTDLSRMFFGLAMSRYIGQEVDYKQFMSKNWKRYNLKDETTGDAQ